jgi:hypothetical protein
VYTTVGAYLGGVLAPNGDIHFVPHSADRGQKITPSANATSYSVLVPEIVEDSTLDVNMRQLRGNISYSEGLSTYSLVYTTTNAYEGGVLDPNGDIHFVPFIANRGQKISSAGVVSTYSLVYTTAAGAYSGGVLDPNGDIHFVPNSARVGQKVSSAGVVSTYSLVYTVSNAYAGGVLAPNGDVHFITDSAVVGQKISSAGVVSTYSLVYTTGGAYFGGVLAPNNTDIYFIPRGAGVGQIYSVLANSSSKLLVKGQVNENPPSSSFDLQYLVLAGGGGMGSPVNDSGGGGAGGYRSSASGERSGANSDPETLFTATIGVTYNVTVGAGGSIGANGSSSNFDTIISIGGGSGGSSTTRANSGGSGGGAGIFSFTSPAGTTNQGTSGAVDRFNSADAVGGGGAGFPPANSQFISALHFGGNGLSSNITSIPTMRGGGGGGGADSISVTNGGSDVGGRGTTNGNSGNGIVSTGSGGGGQASGTYIAGGLGGSGVVILKYPYDYTINLDPGLSATTTTVAQDGFLFEVAQITQGTGIVSWQFRNT